MPEGNSIGTDAVALAAAVRAGTVSAREVTEQHLEHIDRINTELNAIVTVAAESALLAADGIDARIARGERVGDLAGVPFTVKDLIATAGVR
ncbi:MAG: amidase, partial [Actinobacteria bacterium]|nr:amidase [Actinomycetota bacterium]